MLLTLTTTHRPATDLGFLLHKHPERPQSVALPFGHAHVFYPEANPERLTAALLLEIDPVGLTRRAERPSFALYPYVNNRPYVASSFLSLALARTFGSALNGVCKTRPELLDEPLPLSATLAALPCRGGAGMLESLFGPLGYDLRAEPTPLDPAFQKWGASDLYTVTLRHTLPLKDLLRHLYVLVPVLDDEKHYWVGDEEVAKLLDKGAGWLERHPARDEIARRYLRHQRDLTRAAREQLGGTPKKRRTARGFTTSASAPCFRRSEPAARRACSTLGAARGGFSRTSWPNRSLRSSSVPTCPCARFRGRAGGSGWTNGPNAPNG